MSKPILALTVLALTLGGCASMHGQPKAEEVLPTPTAPNERTRLYAACLHEASGEGGQVEKFGHYVRLTCHGPAARAMFDAAATFAAARQWEASTDAGVVRYLSNRKWDDQCARLGADYSCRIHLPVGAFLEPSEDTPPTAKKK